MISDVPVGFLASGGVDSTALLSFASQQTDKPIQTFTIGFEDEHFADERPYARMAAERFGARHHEITMSAEQFRDFLPYYVWHMEDPVCEPPAVALHYVSRMARRHVKVLLSGEGGDEAFGGYQNYRNQLFLEWAMKKVAGPMRSPLGRALAALDKLREAWPARPLQPGVGHQTWVRTTGAALRPRGLILTHHRTCFLNLSWIRFQPHATEAFMQTLHHRVRDFGYAQQDAVCRHEKLAPGRFADQGGQDNDGQLAGAARAAIGSHRAGVCGPFALEFQGPRNRRRSASSNGRSKEWCHRRFWTGRKPAFLCRTNGGCKMNCGPSSGRRSAAPARWDVAIFKQTL